VELEPQLEAGIIVMRRKAGRGSAVAGMKTTTSAFVSTTESVGWVAIEWPGASSFWNWKNILQRVDFMDRYTTSSSSQTHHVMQNNIDSLTHSS
jgi:hypothetical protein